MGKERAPRGNRPGSADITSSGYVRRGPWENPDVVAYGPRDARGDSDPRLLS